MEEDMVALFVEEPAPLQEAAIVIPAPPPSATEIPPSVVDVPQPSADDSHDIIVVDDDHAIRRMRGNRKTGLFIGLSLMAVAVATVIVLVFAR
jgi:hypothetical protein